MTNTTLTNISVALDKSLFGKTFITTGSDGTHDQRFYSRIYNACVAMGWRWRNLISEEKVRGVTKHNKLNAFLCVRLLREYRESYLADPDRTGQQKEYISKTVTATIAEIHRRAA